jgi:hypothetical protein
MYVPTAEHAAVSLANTVYKSHMSLVSQIIISFLAVQRRDGVMDLIPEKEEGVMRPLSESQARGGRRDADFGLSGVSKTTSENSQRPRRTASAGSARSGSGPKDKEKSKKRHGKKKDKSKTSTAELERKFELERLQFHGGGNSGAVAEKVADEFAQCLRVARSYPKEDFEAVLERELAKFSQKNEEKAQAEKKAALLTEWSHQDKQRFEYAHDGLPEVVSIWDSGHVHTWLRNLGLPEATAHKARTLLTDGAQLLRSVPVPL